MYRPLPDELVPRNSEVDGTGLFAVVDVPTGTNFGITHVRDDRFENGLIRTPLGGFINHTDTDPNVYLEKGEEFYELITLKDIKAGDELLLTYHMYDPTK